MIKASKTIKDSHLTLDYRLTIQEGLKQGLNLNATNSLIGKVENHSYKIKSHMRIKKNGCADFSNKSIYSLFDHLKYPLICANCDKKCAIESIHRLLLRYVLSKGKLLVF